MVVVGREIRHSNSLMLWNVWYQTDRTRVIHTDLLWNLCWRLKKKHSKHISCKMCAHFSSWSTYVWFHANIFSWSRSTTLKNHVHSLLNCKGKCFLKKCIAAQILLINNIMREHFNSCICISVSFFFQQYSIMQPAQIWLAAWRVHWRLDWLPEQSMAFQTFWSSILEFIQQSNFPHGCFQKDISEDTGILSLNVYEMELSCTVGSRV